MNTIERNQLLQELRTLAGQAGKADAGKLNLGAATAAGPTAAQQFGALFSNAVGNVNALQQEAGALQTRVEMGDKSVSLVQAMVASQKASIAFQATVQVRNRLVSAYQDIMNMPV